jgi:hypothetical protein
VVPLFDTGVEGVQIDMEDESRLMHLFVASRLAGSLFALIVPLETWTEKKQGDLGMIDILFSISGYFACTSKTMSDNHMIPWVNT